VYISCDGVFNKVNFNVLKKHHSGQYVIDEWLIRRLSNTRELVEIRKLNASSKKLNSATLIGYADFNLSKEDVIREDEKRSVAHQYGFDTEEIPILPATQKEVEILGGLMEQKEWQVNKLTQEKATEDNLKSEAGNSVLHIATHGFFLEDVSTENLSNEDDFLSNPLFQSGILLSGASVPYAMRNGSEDGVLTAYEAMNLNLENTELVALSACETGLGTIQNGEGVFGLQRSFLMAGANSLLMSLWQVDDAATQQLMVDFYTFWLGGTEKHEAFRQAQLKNKQHYNDPYYWGGFIMIGK
jgi:CHAT domain-containing protein